MENSESIKNNIQDSFLYKYKYLILGGLGILFVVLTFLIFFNFYLSSNSETPKYNVLSNNSGDTPITPVYRTPSLDKEQKNSETVSNISENLNMSNAIPEETIAPPVVFEEEPTGALTTDQATAPPVVFEEEPTGALTTDQATAPPVVFE